MTQEGSRRVLGAFPSFASQASMSPRDGFERTLGGHGMSVYKHGRWGQPKKRLLMWDRNDRNSIYWCPDYSEMSSVMRMSEIPPDARKLSLHDIIEIRRGTEEDPLAPGYCGTATLRRCCAPTQYTYSISLILRNRTIDIEFVSKADFKKLVPSLLKYFKAFKESGGAEDVDVELDDVYY
mmetsp:Transcript_14446/g.21716  ORF Transcript_14446/g.21716 Transcript_14446/m.21716 type:complete len:180 (+) Transcript_14446:89-628(+)